MKKRIFVQWMSCLMVCILFFCTLSVRAEGISESENAVELSSWGENGYVVNFRTKSDASVTSYKEDLTGNAGYLNGSHGADGVYLGQEGDQVKFMISGVTAWVDASEVQILSLANVNSFSHYRVENKRLVHYISNDPASDTYWATVDNGPAPAYLTEGVMYYSYDGHYFYPQGQWDRMVGDYQSRTRNNAINSKSPFYNYFQYLPLRSKTNYTTDEFNSILNQRITSANSKLLDAGKLFVQNQDTYGVNALLMAAIGANESGWGTSSIARNKNNLFGLNAVDSSPGESATVFDSPEHCIREYAQYYMSQQYLYPIATVYSGGYLGDKASGIGRKYASAPYWGEINAAIAWSLDQQGGGKDQYKYILGIKGDACWGDPHVSVNMKSYPSAEQGSVVYETGNTRCMSMIVLGQENGFYQIQSDGILNDQKTGLTKERLYDFDSMKVYISSTYLNLVQGQADAGFLDVSEGDWYYDAVTYAKANNIMNGLTPYQFGPAESLARAQFAVILYRLEGEPSVPITTQFSDVTAEEWYAPAVSWAASEEIITGYSGTSMFGPNDDLSREQMVTLLYRYAKYKNFSVSGKADLSRYPDHTQINDYAIEAVKWAVYESMIQGDQGLINPNGTTNRAMCAVVIQRFIDQFDW